MNRLIHICLPLLYNLRYINSLEIHGEDWSDVGGRHENYVPLKIKTQVSLLEVKRSDSATRRVTFDDDYDEGLSLDRESGITMVRVV